MSARVQRGPATFHLVGSGSPARAAQGRRPAGGDEGEAERTLAEALPLLSEAAGAPVTGHVGDHEPLMAIEDAINRAPYDELIISTLPRRLSRWLRLDVVSEARGWPAGDACGGRSGGAGAGRQGSALLRAGPARSASS